MQNLTSAQRSNIKGLREACLFDFWKPQQDAPCTERLVGIKILLLLNKKRTLLCFSMTSNCTSPSKFVHLFSRKTHSCMFVVFKMNTRNHTITYIYKLSGLYTKVKFTHTWKYEEVIYILRLQLYRTLEYRYLQEKIPIPTFRKLFEVVHGVNINMLKNRYF